MNDNRKMSREWFEMRAAGGGIVEVSIYGNIGKSWVDENAVSASEFSKVLTTLGDISEIILRVNSPGGDVFDGVAIHNLLKQHPAPVIAYIDGLAASVASYIVMAANEIIMPSNTFMLVHEPMGGAFGTADTMMSMAADLELMTGTFAATYSARTGMDVDDIKALMKEDRLMEGAEAVRKGFADTLGDPIKMAANYSMRWLSPAIRTCLEKVMEVQLAAAVPPARSVIEQTIEPEQSNIINLDDAHRKGEQSAYAASQEIAELCALAGLPQMAAKFISARTTIPDMRRELIKARAEQSEKDAIRGAHAETTNMKSGVESWVDVVEKLNKQNSRNRH